MHLTLGFSPCPNDTYIFDALVHNKIDTHGYTFAYHLHDVESLNLQAQANTYHITKLSFAAAALLQQQYALLPSGAALGKGVGPLLVSNVPHISNDYDNAIAQLQQFQVAIPGMYTTAHFLLKYYATCKLHSVVMPFHVIQDWVLQAPHGSTRLGVLIHENRFTYHQHGLHLVQDLGSYWESLTQLPIPLGGIFIQNALPMHVRQDIGVLIQQSILYANANYTTTLPTFVTKHAQEMATSVQWQHIKLYVNEHSITLNNEAMQAIDMLYSLMQA